MERLWIVAMLLVQIATAGTAHAQVAPVGATAQLHDASGRLLAMATFRESSDQVFINLTFPDRAGLIGTHAMHIHQIGRCDPPDFASAGPIFDPDGKQHGLKNPAGPKPGDLPNLVIGPAGVSVYNLAAPLVTLTTGPNALVRPAGTSLVIFAQPDDDASQPEGNAGARIACGIITASGNEPGDDRPDLLHALGIGAMGALLIASGVVLRRPEV